MKLPSLLISLTLSGMCLAAPATADSRKDVLALASRVADWQLAHMEKMPAGVTSFGEETQRPRSWQKGAFWVGMTRLADVTKEKRFRDAILAQGRSNAWQPGPRIFHADDHVITQSYLWAARNGAGTSVSPVTLMLTTAGSARSMSWAKLTIGSGRAGVETLAEVLFAGGVCAVATD